MIQKTCDKCGLVADEEKDWQEFQEFQKIDFIGGYGSIFGDGTHVNLDICQHCLYTFVGDVVEKKNKTSRENTEDEITLSIPHIGIAY